MPPMASPSRREPQSRVTKRPWTQDETGHLVLGLQAGYPYSEIRRLYLQRRSIRACKARVETLEKNGMLANFLPIAPQPSSTARPRTAESRNDEAPPRRRPNPPRRSRFPGVHADQSLASAGEATDATYISPDFSDGEDSDDSYVDPSSDIDVPNASPPDTHNPMDAAATSTMMAPTDEAIDQVQLQNNISVEQTAPSMPQSQEATSAEVEARRLHNSVREIWNQISQFYIKYPAPDVNVHQIDEWDEDCEDIHFLLLKWTRDLPPQYAVVNGEIPTDAPTDLIVAHLEYRVAQIKWYGPMHNCDPSRRPHGIFKSPEKTCVVAARDIVSILEQHLRRTPLYMMSPHLKALATATLTAFSALKDRAPCPDQDILMAQRIAQILASLLNVLHPLCTNECAQQSQLLGEDRGKFQMHPTNTTIPDLSPRHQLERGMVRSMVRLLLAILDQVEANADSAQCTTEEEANMNVHASAAGPSNFIGGPNDERQRRQAAASPLTYAAPSEISQNPFSEAGYNFYGNEPMYGGITGKEFAADIYIGVVYYQRLRYVVSDKFQVRTTGPVNALHVYTKVSRLLRFDILFNGPRTPQTY
ncbi:hypothetical protein AYO20_02629 [Fonsecaea nubica]|uniref:DNA-directed RNA polymerase n=1 Tax=Fonsecaea nubica TaxID=856822 RepID=A0A178D948_9EURO|nr:hypothetical protein AYO20_02629 [Fonsecaea nubica]OAL38177.1 hypothetical protein AYO20_02629 [Fonsecaea nubica]